VHGENSPRRSPPPHVKLPGITGTSGRSSRAQTYSSPSYSPVSFFSLGTPSPGNESPNSRGHNYSSLSIANSKSYSTSSWRTLPMPVPPYLTFESWWTESACGVVHATLQYTTATHICAAFLSTTPSSVSARVNLAHSQVGGRGSGEAECPPRSCGHCQSQAVVDPWDLHVGAELRLLGRRITLKKVGRQASLGVRG
jgi:hypothetical protein